MRSIMRNALVAAGVMVVCVSGTARASTTTVMKANVPFPFVVNGQNFPAGKYMIQRDDSSPSVMVIRGEDNNRLVTVVLTAPDNGRDPEGSRPALAFNRFEHQYRLSSIWESADEGRDVIVR